MNVQRHGQAYSHAPQHRHPTGRYCARCTYPLHHLPAGNVWIDHCYRCGGSFLDGGKAGQAVGPHADPSSWQVEAFARAPIPSVLLCPSGHGRLWSYLLKSGEREVELDSCSTCKGLWLDAREAELLAAISAEAEEDSKAPGASKGKLGIAAVYLMQLCLGLPIEVRAPVRRKPVLVWSLVAMCSIVFAVQLGFAATGRIEGFVKTFGVVPTDVLAGKNVFSIISYAFLHGGFMHILGNLYMLWVFGDNVEDRLGRLRFALLYVVTAVAGALLYILIRHGSDGVMVGASGAISGVFAAYLILFPRVKLWVVMFFVRFRIPAWGYMFIWGVSQVVIMLNPSSGVAWQAHAGGFLAGVGLTYLLRPKQSVDAPPSMAMARQPGMAG